ncbi:alpha/beta fold hydrolase [Mesomycoplasma flocculare]|uniref:Triacylglycerol lipase n=1 Tax=Mesomycoplasma flocculare ATCC 27399 TaxID=743971 RepID=A0A0A8E8E8_MESFC|nr:alpha/beta hydrolase [Mesomycoplasma flocculare]AJC49882.1 triacylglycerol lipase [Mesomycoplasma flocculare ATCC 27399]ENX51218.1 triacylglycerol lipase [Mesomycoplasma flocculare ATCC 27716]
MQANKKIQVKNEEIFYFLEENNRPKVLFLHGFNSSHNFIFQLRKNKYRKYDIITFDFPGCGQSTSNGDISVEYYQKIAREFIKTLNLKIEIVVGHSLGATIALDVFKEKLAKKAVLVAPLNPYIFEHDLENELKKLGLWLLPKNLEQAKNSLANLVYENKFGYKNNLAENATKFFRAVEKKEGVFSNIVFNQILNLNWHKNVLLPLYKQKNNYLLIAGVKDNFVSLKSLEKVAIIFGQKIIKLENTGHAIFFEKSEEVNAEIEKIL